MSFVLSRDFIEIASDTFKRDDWLQIFGMARGIPSWKRRDCWSGKKRPISKSMPRSYFLAIDSERNTLRSKNKHSHAACTYWDIEFLFRSAMCLAPETAVAEFCRLKSRRKCLSTFSSPTICGPTNEDKQSSAGNINVVARVGNWQKAPFRMLTQDAQ